MRVEPPNARSACICRLFWTQMEAICALEVQAASSTLLGSGEGGGEPVEG